MARAREFGLCVELDGLRWAVATCSSWPIGWLALVGIFAIWRTRSRTWRPGLVAVQASKQVSKQARRSLGAD